MRSYDVERTIDAPVEAVWSVLTTQDVATWDSGVRRVEGTVAEGQRIKVYSEVSPDRAFPVRVALDDTRRVMTWTGGMPLGLFRGVRTFTVTQAGEGSRFTMREEFTGPLLPLIWRTMPDLQPSFEKFAEGLRRRAEDSARHG